MIRRLVALLTTVATLHLSVAAGDAACAPHATSGHATGGAAAVQSAMPVDGHVMPAAVAPAIPAAYAAGSDITPCETPAPQHCCEALSGCGPTSVVESHRPASPCAEPAAVRIRGALHDALASFAPAPEPPPPKV
jgi:hypothetical protein